MWWTFVKKCNYIRRVLSTSGSILKLNINFESLIPARKSCTVHLRAGAASIHQRCCSGTRNHWPVWVWSGVGSTKPTWMRSSSRVARSRLFSARGCSGGAHGWKKENQEDSTPLIVISMAQIIILESLDCRAIKRGWLNVVNLLPQKHSFYKNKVEINSYFSMNMVFLVHPKIQLENLHLILRPVRVKMGKIFKNITQNTPTGNMTSTRPQRLFVYAEILPQKSV